MARKKTTTDGSAPQVRTPAPPPPHAAANGRGVEQLIDLKAIHPSPTNPRRHFPEDTIRELADSIRQQGLLQPLVVRPIRGKLVQHETLNGFRIETPDGRRQGFVPIQEMDAVDRALAEGGLYELVAGERRLRACRLLDLFNVPCIVCEMADDAAAEAQLVENDQREDLGPLERAEGYHAHLERFKLTVEQLAVRIGKSVAQVRGLLRLRHLPQTAKEAVDRGELPVETAALIARLPTAELRAQLAQEVLTTGAAEAPLSSRATKERIATHYLKELKGAPSARPARPCFPRPVRAGTARSAPATW